MIGRDESFNVSVLRTCTKNVLCSARDDLWAQGTVLCSPPQPRHWLRLALTFKMIQLAPTVSNFWKPTKLSLELSRILHLFPDFPGIGMDKIDGFAPDRRGYCSLHCNDTGSLDFTHTKSLQLTTCTILIILYWCVMSVMSVSVIGWNWCPQVAFLAFAFLELLNYWIIGYLIQALEKSSHWSIGLEQWQEMVSCWMASYGFLWLPMASSNANSHVLQWFKTIYNAQTGW